MCSHVRGSRERKRQNEYIRRRRKALPDRAGRYGGHLFLQQSCRGRCIFDPSEFRPRPLSRLVQRDRAEPHLGPAAAHPGRHDRSIVSHSRRHPGRPGLQRAIRHEPRHQAPSVGRVHGTRVGPEHQRAAHPGRRQGRQPPDSRSILDRRLHQCLDQFPEPACCGLGRQPADPGHVQYRWRFRDRRTVHFTEHQRHRDAAGRRLHRRRPTAHPARPRSPTIPSGRRRRSTTR